MELIKKIKQAEAEAEQIILQAKADAVKQAEAFRVNRQNTLEQAEKERKKAIETAVLAAEGQAKGEVEKMTAEADKRRRELRAKATGRLSQAAAKVVGLLKG